MTNRSIGKRPDGYHHGRHSGSVTRYAAVSLLALVTVPGWAVVRSVIHVRNARAVPHCSLAAFAGLFMVPLMAGAVIWG
ncbi:hypothetical protein [Streptomyces ipomoeae]|uniref:hypothetical protein n=1 Tax=Streptomyces ipomoeae TaxID=103232 RepID=UPI0011464C71|nr:hypothetical protein [Streptomyces ipomoeae]MDX2939771.1 hypothetical protein [Streptomyces ipomoeae]TQE15670.1 hypothetical protein SipoB123_43035 [Streptomyces ipomoeae]